MNMEEFAAFVKDVIDEEVHAHGPCGCCGMVEIQGIPEAVARIVEGAKSIER